MAEGKGRTRKRPVLDEADLCIVCQKDTKQKLMKVSRDSLESVNTVRQLRLKLRSDNFRDTTDRLTVIFQADTQRLFSWHKDCRSNYMSKSKIDRLRMTGQEGMTGHISSPSTSMSSPQKCLSKEQNTTDRLESAHLLPAKEKSITSPHTRNECQHKNTRSCTI